MNEEVRVPELRVISMDEIRERAKGTIVEISDWDPSKKIAVRVKAVDMTPFLLKIDKLPNILKSSATAVFKDDGSDAAKVQALDALDSNSMEEMLPIIDGVVQEVLVEPAFDEIQKVYPLTLGQKMELFRMAMGGIEALDSFR